jgi:hypothetical protein
VYGYWRTFLTLLLHIAIQYVSLLIHIQKYLHLIRIYQRFDMFWLQATIHVIKSCGSSVSIVYDYGLDNRVIEARSPTGAENPSSSPCVQTGSEAHTASYPMGIGGPFPGGKARPRRDADHPPPSLLPRLSMSSSYTSLLPYASMACSGTALLLPYT